MDKARVRQMTDEDALCACGHPKSLHIEVTWQTRACEWFKDEHRGGETLRTRCNCKKFAPPEWMSGG